MINDDENAFLKSIKGTSPIKKTNKLKKEIRLPSFSKKKKLIVKEVEVKKLNHNFKTDTVANVSFNFENTPLNKKLKKGKIPIDQKVDFHGMSLLEAEILFSETIFNCYENKSRCLLFITGKGVLKKNYENSDQIKLYYGKIRNSFFSWIKKNELQKYILAVEQANMDHGADGAFFVYLRKNKF